MSNAGGTTVHWRCSRPTPAVRWCTDGTHVQPRRYGGALTVFTSNSGGTAVHWRYSCPTPAVRRYNDGTHVQRRRYDGGIFTVRQKPLTSVDVVLRRFATSPNSCSRKPVDISVDGWFVALVWVEFNYYWLCWRSSSTTVAGFSY